MLNIWFLALRIAAVQLGQHRIGNVDGGAEIDQGRDAVKGFAGLINDQHITFQGCPALYFFGNFFKDSVAFLVVLKLFSKDRKSVV